LVADLRNLARPYQIYVEVVELWSVESETIGYATNIISREHHLVNLFVEVSVGNESSYRNTRVILELHSKFKQVIYGNDISGCSRDGLDLVVVSISVHQNIDCSVRLLISNIVCNHIHGAGEHINSHVLKSVVGCLYSASVLEQLDFSLGKFKLVNRNVRAFLYTRHCNIELVIIQVSHGTLLI